MMSSVTMLKKKIKILSLKKKKIKILSNVLFRKLSNTQTGKKDNKHPKHSYKDLTNPNILPLVSILFILLSVYLSFFSPKLIGSKLQTCSFIPKSSVYVLHNPSYHV